MPDIKPTVSHEAASIPELTPSAPATQPPAEEPIQKEEIREDDVFANDDARAMVVQDMEGELPPTPDETSSEEIRPDAPVEIPFAEPVLINDEQPPTPVSVELDITDVAVKATASIRSDSPLSSIISISPPPPTRPKKTKRPRIEDPSEDDHLDTSPPEYATLSPHGLGEVTTQINNHYLYIFYRFCAERHQMTVMRNNGVPRDSLTDDECMKKERVGNIYRELDPSSKRLVDDVIGKGDQTNEEICCESKEYETSGASASGSEGGEMGKGGELGGEWRYCRWWSGAMWMSSGTNYYATYISSPLAQPAFIVFPFAATYIILICESPYSR
jgi:hypothetical protein